MIKNINGKQCQNKPEYSNGWKKRNVTKLIISTIIWMKIFNPDNIISECKKLLQRIK